ncbi:MAG: hypothetical protein OHK0013_18650 [Sandaracinaceae bacterium]
MTRRCYPSANEGINRASGAPGRVVVRRAAMRGLAALVAVVAPHVAAQEGPFHGGREDGLQVLVWMQEHARAHPYADGPVTITRHDRAFARTVQERGRLVLAPTGLRATLDAPSHLELVAQADRIALYDGPSRALLDVAEPTPLVGYAELLAGSDLTARFHARVLRDDVGSVALELLPRGALSWLDVDRVVVRVDAEGTDRGRIQRALVTWPTGDWLRIDLDALDYPASVDPRALALPPHPEATRIEP